VGGVQVGLLKAEDSRVAILDVSLQVREPSSETIHVPLQQIRDG
jgi:hypothetical protein